MMAEKLATLSFTDGTPSADFPINSGTVGRDVIDIRPLYSKTGKFTYDPGFMSTGSCSSKITYIDGDKGVLMYRGYPIEQLAEHCDFLEVAYLILNGELPNRTQNEKFVSTIGKHTMVHEQLVRFFSGFRRDAHPMAVMCGVIGALSAFSPDSPDFNDQKHREISAYRLIAKVPTITAMCYKYNMGQPFMYPRNSLSYVENFLYMMFGTPCEEYKPNPVLSPAHGGANEAVLNMLAQIGDVSNIGKYIARVKDKNDNAVLFGFGHRVYKNYDPRARLIQKTCHEVLDELGLKDT